VPPWRMDARSRLATLQGAYFTATGIWPIVHLRSFEAVTGPKLEGWLVKTLGAVLGVVGGILALAGARRRVTQEVALLGAGCAAALAVADVHYGLVRRRIAPVYALEGLVEVAIAAGWAVTALRPERRAVVGTSAPRTETTLPRPYGGGRRDVIEQASWESFPASDPPAW
jgi:hypothetical protein